MLCEAAIEMTVIDLDLGIGGIKDLYCGVNMDTRFFIDPYLSFL